MDFLNLPAYRLGQQLRERLLSALTRIPPDERLAVADEVWRAATAVTSNLVEGAVNQSNGQVVAYLDLSRASLHRLAMHLPRLNKSGYLSDMELTELCTLTKSTSSAIEDVISAAEIES